MKKLPKLWWRYSQMPGGLVQPGSAPPLGPGEMVLTQGSGYTSLQDYILTLGPIAYWPLNDPAGSLTARDVTGNGYIGSVVGNVTFGNAGLTSYGETAAVFVGGTYSHIQVPLPNSIPFTIVGLTSNTGTVIQNTWFSQGIDSSAGFRTSHDVITAYDTLIQTANSAGSYATAPGTAGTTLSAIAIDGSNNYASSNGSAWVSKPIGTTILYPQLSGIGLKSLIVGGAADFAGTIAHVAIFPYILTPAQLTALQNVITAGPKYEQWQGMDITGSGVPCWGISSRGKWLYAQPVNPGGFKISTPGYFESDIMTFGGGFPQGIFTVSGTPIGRLFIQA